jgi:hypothetical protein
MASHSSGDNKLNLREPNLRALPLKLFEKLRAAQLKLVQIRRRIHLYVQLASGDICNFTVPGQRGGQQLAPGFGDLAEPGLPGQDLLVHKLPNGLIQPDGTAGLSRSPPLNSVV